MQAPLDRDFGTITLGWNIENGGGDGDAMFMFQRYSLNSPHSLLPLLCPQVSSLYLVYLFVYLSKALAHTASYVGSSFQEQGWNPHPLRWKVKF